ncbi:MAG: histone deacetylase family protein [Alphaproteobacteria bacterium]|nr:histone deacetylase family protein [Alphaproteobacteria bacterium]
MTTLILSHPACLDHRPGEGHPEAPARLKAVLEGLQDWQQTAGAGALAWVEAPLADREKLILVHAPDHVDTVLEAIPEDGFAYLDADTGLSPGTREAALRAAGAVVAAVDAVVSGAARNAFAAVRPPGHHAEPSRSMGFCLFNNIAIGALHAREAHGLDRVAVVDFDVHHGNGTEAAFREDDGLFFASSHQFPFYPGTGSGKRDSDHILNAPLAPGSGGREFRAAWQGRILPALRDFEPEMVFISAGFDAHTRDPLAQINLTQDDFAWVTGEIRSIAEACCSGRIVSTLEGGYDLDALAASAVAHVAALAAE